MAARRSMLPRIKGAAPVGIRTRLWARGEEKITNLGSEPMFRWDLSFQAEGRRPKVLPGAPNLEFARSDFSDGIRKTQRNGVPVSVDARVVIQLRQRKHVIQDLAESKSVGHLRRARYFGGGTSASGSNATMRRCGRSRPVTTMKRVPSGCTSKFA